MTQESFFIVRYRYEMGVYSLQQMIEFVDKQWITRKQFKEITSYSYEGLTDKKE